MKKSEILSKAEKLYPHSEFMRNQWIKQTTELMKSKKHLLAVPVQRKENVFSVLS